MTSRSSAPEKFHSSLVRMNELYQSEIIGDEHLIMQEIGAFSSKFGLIYDDPIRSMKDMNKKFPTLTFVSECMRESMTGKQAYKCYLGKHNVGQGTKGLLRGSKALDDAKRFNHVAPSNSSFKKKAAAPIVSNGVIVNYILIMLRMCAKLTDVKSFWTSLFSSVLRNNFDRNALSPGGTRYGDSIYGISPVITLETAKNMCDRRYQEMLKLLFKK